MIFIADPDKDGIILDFFSGSATTAQAVFEMNAKENSKWFKLMGVIYAFEQYGKNWDEPEIEEGEVDEICKEVIRKILSATPNKKNN